MSKKIAKRKGKRVLPRKQGRTLTKDQKIKRYEKRLEIDYVCESGIGKKRKKRLLTEKEKLTFPDAVFVRDIEIQHLESENLEQYAALSDIIDYINSEMEKTLEWNRDNLPEALRPIYDIIYDSELFIDYELLGTDCQESCQQNPSKRQLRLEPKR